MKKNVFLILLNGTIQDVFAAAGVVQGTISKELAKHAHTSPTMFNYFTSLRDKNESRKLPAWLQDSETKLVHQHQLSKHFQTIGIQGSDFTSFDAGEYELVDDTSSQKKDKKSKEKKSKDKKSKAKKNQEAINRTASVGNKKSLALNKRSKKSLTLKKGVKKHLSKKRR